MSMRRKLLHVKLCQATVGYWLLLSTRIAYAHVFEFQ